MSASSDAVGPEIENGCPELWTYVKAKLEEARRKGFFAAASALPALHTSSSKRCVA